MATKKTTAAPRAKAKAAAQELPLKASAPAVTKTAALALPAQKAAKPAAKKPTQRVAPRATPRATPKAAPKPAAPAQVASYKVAVDFDKAGQDVIETYALCSSIAAEGLATLSQEVVGFTRSSVEAQFALTQALLGATSFEEALEAQNEYTRESFSNLTAEFAKLTGLSLELSQKLMEPVQTQVNEAARTIWEPHAA